MSETRRDSATDLVSSTAVAEAASPAVPLSTWPKAGCACWHFPVGTGDFGMALRAREMRTAVTPVSIFDALDRVDLAVVESAVSMVFGGGEDLVLPSTAWC